MTKAEFAAKVSEKFPFLNQSNAMKAVTAVFDAIEEALKRGEDIAIGHVGRLSVQKRSARKGRNPVTGKAITIPARKVIAFHQFHAFRNEL